MIKNIFERKLNSNPTLATNKTNSETINSDPSNTIVPQKSISSPVRNNSCSHLMLSQNDPKSRQRTLTLDQSHCSRYHQKNTTMLIKEVAKIKDDAKPTVKVEMPVLKIYPIPTNPIQRKINPNVLLKKKVETKSSFFGKVPNKSTYSNSTISQRSVHKKSNSSKDLKSTTDIRESGLNHTASVTSDNPIPRATTSLTFDGSNTEKKLNASRSSIHSNEQRWWRSSFICDEKQLYLRSPTLLSNIKKADIWDIEHLILLQDSISRNSLRANAKTKASSKDIKRLQIVMEFFSNELRFVECLSLIGKHFYDPIKSQKILNEEDFLMIFSNLKELFKQHKKFLEVMATNIRLNTIDKEFANIVFNEFKGENQTMYESIWCRFFEKNVTGREVLRNLRAKDGKVKNFLTNLENDPNLLKIGLNDLMQRIHKHLVEYPIYIDRIIANTPPNREDKNILNEASEGCKAMLEAINNRIRISQNVQLMAQAQKVVEKTIKTEKKYDELFPPNFDLLTQTFVHSDFVVVKSKSGRLYDCHFLLTTYCFLILRKVESNYMLKPIEMVPLDSTKKISTFIIFIHLIVDITEDPNNSKEIHIISKDSSGNSFQTIVISESNLKASEIKLFIKKTHESFRNGSKPTPEAGKTKTIELDSVPNETILNSDVSDRIALLEKTDDEIIRSSCYRNFILSSIKNSDQMYSDSTVWDKIFNGMTLLIEKVNSPEKEDVKLLVATLIEDLKEFETQETKKLAPSRMMSINSMVEDQSNEQIENTTSPKVSKMEPNRSFTRRST